MYHYCIIYVQYSVVVVEASGHSSERLLFSMYLYLSENQFTQTISMTRELTTIEGHHPATLSSQAHWLQLQEP